MIDWLNSSRLLVFLLLPVASTGGSVALAETLEIGEKPKNPERQRAILGRYVGEWTGRYEMRLAESEKVATSFSTHATYRWQGNAVQGRLIHGFENGMGVYELRMEFDAEGNLSMEVESDEGVAVYAGIVRENTIEWRSSDDRGNGGWSSTRDHFLKTQEDRVQIGSRTVFEMKQEDGTILLIQSEGFLIPKNS